MTPDELTSLRAHVAEMKALGILHLKTPCLEILLGAGYLPPAPKAALPAPAPTTAMKPDSAPVPVDPTPKTFPLGLHDPEGLLFAATEGLPDEDVPI